MNRAEPRLRQARSSGNTEKCNATSPVDEHTRVRSHGEAPLATCQLGFLAYRLSISTFNARVLAARPKVS